MMRNRLLGLIFATLVSFTAFGQAGSGEIYGTVSDEMGPLPGARVTVYQGGIVKFQVVTNTDGKYSIKPVPSGNYEVEASFVGIGDRKLEVTIATDANYKQDFKLGETEGVQTDTSLGPAIAVATKLLSTDRPTGTDFIGGKEIADQASRNTSQFANLATGVLSTRAGDASSVSIDGGRDENTVYMIDGMIVRGARNVNLPIGSISSVEVMTTGLQAKYGDATGGVIALTTKGISSKTGGGLYWERSVEGYGHNQVSLNLSGPLFSKYDSTIKNKRPVAGYFLAADYIDDKDNNPTYYKNATLKQEKIDWLNSNPLTQNISGGQTFQSNSDFITDADFRYLKYRENARRRAAQLVSKLDFIPSIQTNITLGFQLNYIVADAYSRANSLVTPQANTQLTRYSGRSYIRFNHRVPDDPTDSTKRLSNVYYSGQFSYQRDFDGTESPFHKKDFFKYGHVGKFEENLVPVYQPLGEDSSSSLKGYKLLGYQSNNVTYERSENNPILSNYTDYVFQNRGRLPNIQTVNFLGGMRNGDGPNSIYGFYTNVGARPTTFSRSRSDQISFNLESGFTITPKGKGSSHNIELGYYYEQRNDRFYTLGSSGLWTLMRQVVNRHIANLDIANPIYKVGGNEYTYDDFQNGSIPWTSLDTIFYNRKYVESDQAFVDKNIRRKLGLAVDGTDYIQVDALDPSFYELSMFSADDLFNQGSAYMNMSGYDHLGNLLKGKTSFNAFFTEKDENGNFTRRTPSFQPIYMAGYIMDKFRFQEIQFNIGLRLDRYDANTKVLRDPYSLYGVRHVSDLEAGGYNTFENVGIPGNIGQDYVVYVADNSTSKPTIAGYRNGDIWYDPYGREVNDPRTIQNNYTGGSNNLQPYLVNPNDDIKEADNEMLNRSFVDYKPQLTASPRIQLSFPINDVSMVFAHYDIIVQRPKGSNNVGIGNINFFNPYTYYYFLESSASRYANPNLKPERLIEYELGFQQVLSELSRSVLTLSAYYKERKDQIQVRPYFYAFPKQYNAFGNRDFSTSKGIKVKFKSNIGNTSNINLSYTFGLTEGTGSSTTSSASLISSGQGSLRPTAFYLNNDVRHNIKFNAFTTFRLQDHDGFIRGFVNGFNLNLFANLRSGTPFTRYNQARPLGGTQNGDPIIGGINGSRLPWSFQLDLKGSKDFYLRKAQIAESGEMVKKPIMINAFCYVQNILNRKNVLGVYGYTASPEDDGYLNSVFGQQAISQYPAALQQSYIDIYNLAMYNQPGFFNTPRRITIGLNYNF